MGRRADDRPTETSKNSPYPNALPIPGGALGGFFVAQNAKGNNGKVEDHDENSPTPAIFLQSRRKAGVIVLSFLEICPSFSEASSLALELRTGILFVLAALVPPKLQKKKVPQAVPS